MDGRSIKGCNKDPNVWEKVVHVHIIAPITNK
jgi:hypothetical protein